MRSLVFNRSYYEESYHVAAYTLYRLKSLLSNKRIDQKYGKLRWYIIMAIKYYVCGDTVAKLDSGKIKQSCKKIEQFISSSDEDTVKVINDLCSAIVNINDITRDKLKGSA
jgi:hypothetical protein